MQGVLAVLAALAAVAPVTVPVAELALDAPVAGTFESLVAAPIEAVAAAAAGVVAPLGESVAVADAAPPSERWPDQYRYHRREATFFEDPMLDDLVCGARADGCDPRRAGFDGEFAPLQ